WPRSSRSSPGGPARACSTPPTRTRPSSTRAPPSSSATDRSVPAATVAAELDWLVAAAAGGADADVLPRCDDPFFAPLLDYAREDAFLARRDAARASRAGLRGRPATSP